MTQSEAMDILKLGHNVFLTGAAGSGKTFLLNKYIAYLKFHNISVGITASTGIAATHMGGTTIHSWCGMGIREEMADEEIHELTKKPYLRKHFLQTRVLIIDEISMLHAYQLDLIDRICKAFKKNTNPFGGMQIVMCGDFFQLPPVQRSSKSQALNSKQIQNTNFQSGVILERSDRIPDSHFHGNDSGEEKADFVTESEVWKDMMLRICYLDEQHRQDDRAFLSVLNDIRNGEVNETTVEYLSERLNKEIDGYAKPTRLFSHNADVDAINKQHLDALPGEEHEYFMKWSGHLGLTESLRKSCLAPERLVLKMGAQVMFVKNNFEAGYVNGTLGEVIGFGEDESPKIRTFDGAEITIDREKWEVREDDTVMASLLQFPLRLAWAITVHKSQGMSLDAAEVDLSRSFVPGMGYVALSRVRSLSGLKLMGMNQMALTINSDVAEMDQEFHRLSDEATYALMQMDFEKKEHMQADVLAYMKGI